MPTFRRTPLSVAALAAALLLSGAAFAQQTPDAPLPSSPVPSSQTPSSQTPASQTPATQPATPPSPQPTGPTAVFDTSMGRMTCRLFSQEAPKTVANFIGLATGTKDWTDPKTHQVMHGQPLYNGTTFHRVIPGFMIQGGDPLGTGEGDPGYTFNDEIVPNLNFDVAGRLAMANSGPNTNGSQFFITVAATPWLNQHYTIFGQCSDSSVWVAKSITDVNRDANNKPLQPVMLDKVTIVPPGQPLPPLPPPSAPAPAAQTQAPAPQP